MSSRPAPEPANDPAPAAGPPRVSDEIERWRDQEGAHTLGSLIELFGEKSFAIIFLFLLGVPALPLPTGGATHVFEVIAMLLSLQLIVGRREVWLPERWQRMQMAGPKQQRFIAGLVKMIRWLERVTRPRLARAFQPRLSNSLFGLIVLLLSIGAFVAPPFSGLDTLPSLGAVLVSLAFLLEDVALLVVGLIVGVAGVVLDVVLGQAAFSGIKQLVSAIVPAVAARHGRRSESESASAGRSDLGGGPGSDG